MIRAASRAGFVHEGTLRRAAWVNGEFADEVILDMLALVRVDRGNVQPTDPASGSLRIIAQYRFCAEFLNHQREVARVRRLPGGWSFDPPLAPMAEWASQNPRMTRALDNRDRPGCRT